MSNDNDNMGISETKYNEIYNSNIIGCIDSISRSYSSGINAPSVSSNRLRVYSTDNPCPGPLRVRSSPSSPNRLSRFQCMTLVRRKWSAINKINQSSSSEFDSYPTSCNSNKSLQCDSNVDQLDLSWRVDSSIYSLTNRPNSCQNLKVTDSSAYNHDDFYPLTGDRQTILCSSSSNILLKPLSGVIDEEPSNKNQLQLKYDTKSSHGSAHKDIHSVASKSSSNPLNFKKVLRDRYLNSQKGSNICTATSVSSSSNHMTQAISLTDDYLFHPNEFILPEREDHNFRFLQHRNSQRSLDNDSYIPQSIYTPEHKKSLSIDLQNLSALKKYRIRSNNSTVSSMSGIEAEGDPFSPASTEICSPFLKLNLPYRIPQKQVSECCTPNTLPSFSIGTLTTTQEMSQSQRFFPESMKLSDFHHHPSFKSDCQLNSRIKEQLLLPHDHIGSKSAPQSLQLSPNCTNLLSSALKPIPCPTTDVSRSLAPQIPLATSADEMYFLRPIMSSKSMDYLDSFCLGLDYSANRDLKSDDAEWIKHEESHDKEHELIKTSVVDHKSKLGTTSSHQKRTMQSVSASNQRQCTVCGRYFNRSDMLARHLRVHTGQKPFECSICGQSFSRSDHLNTHMRIHSGEKPYRCSLCSYSACRRDMITRHLRVHRKKGDNCVESVSVLVVNTPRSTANQAHKKISPTKSHNSLNLDLGTFSDDDQLLTMRRSPHLIHSLLPSHHNTPSCSSQRSTTEPSTHTTPPTFPNISISICQPTPRSSFSMPTESQHESETTFNF